MNHLLSLEKRLIVIVVLSLVSLFSLTTFGTTLVVSKSGSQFSSIQEAINSANTGDTIKIKQGIYTENLSINKDLSLKGAGKSKVRVEGHLSLDSSDIEVIIEDLNLIGDEESLIGIGGSAKITIRNSKIRGYYDAIELWNSATVKIEGCSITKSGGIALHLSESSKAILNDCEITKNRLGIGVEDSGSLTVKNCDITGNDIAGVYIGGLALDTTGKVIIENSRIRRNKIGLWNFSRGKVKFHGNNVTDNEINLVGDIDAEVKDQKTEPSQKKIHLPNDSYSTLQSAVNDLLPGGTIILDGEVKGGVVINKKLTIKAGGSNAQLKLHQESIIPVLSLIGGADLTINGVTITKDYDPDYTSQPAVALGKNAKLQLNSARVEGSSTGIVLSGSADASIKNSVIEGEFRGSGIQLIHSSKLTIEDSKFIGRPNSGSRKSGTGLTIGNSSQADIKSCEFKNLDSGIVLLSSSQADIQNTDIIHNKNAITMYHSTNADLVNTEIRENNNGISLRGTANARLASCDIIENQDSGVNLIQSASVSINGSKLVGNEGPGIITSFSKNTEVTVKNSFIKKNDIGIENPGGKLAGFGNEIESNKRNFEIVPKATAERLTMKPDDLDPEKPLGIVLTDGKQFNSIQAAIDSAEPGETIEIKQGIYKENLTINKDLTLKGSGKSKVIIDGHKKGFPVIRVRQSISELEVTVKGMAIKGAEGGECKNREKGVCPSGIAAVGNSNLRLKDVIISGNALGIWVDNSSHLVADNCKINDNKVGIGLMSKAVAEMTGSEIKGNAFDGISLINSATVKIKNSRITNNGEDGIDLVDSTKATVKGSKIAGNKEDGIGLWGSIELTVDYSYIAENSYGVSSWGGSRSLITRSQIIDNEKAGIELAGSAVSKIRNSKVRNNNIGIEIYEANNFGGLLRGAGNVIAGNDDNYWDVPSNVRENLTTQLQEGNLQLSFIDSGGNKVNPKFEIQKEGITLKSGAGKDTVALPSGEYRVKVFAEGNLTKTKGINLRRNRKKSLRIVLKGQEEKSTKSPPGFTLDKKYNKVGNEEIFGEKIRVPKDLQGFAVKAEFENSWSAEMPYAYMFPDLDMTLISPDGKRYYSELVEVKQLSGSKTEGREKITEGVSVFEPTPGKWRVKIETNSSVQWNTESLVLKVRKMNFEGTDIQVKLRDPNFPRNKSLKKKGKTLAYINITQKQDSLYNLRIFPNLGTVIPSVPSLSEEITSKKSSTYPGVNSHPAGLMILGYSETSFDRAKEKVSKAQRIFYSVDGEVKTVTKPEKNMAEQYAIAVTKDLAGLIPGVGLLTSETTELVLKTIAEYLGIEEAKPTNHYHKPVSKAFKTDNGFDHYINSWSAQEFEADYGDSIRILFDLKSDRVTNEGGTFYVYLKLIFAHDSIGETSKPQDSPKVFEESIELKVSTDKQGKVTDVKKIIPSSVSDSQYLLKKYQQYIN